MCLRSLTVGSLISMGVYLDIIHLMSRLPADNNHKLSPDFVSVSADRRYNIIINVISGSLT